MIWVLYEVQACLEVLWLRYYEDLGNLNSQGNKEGLLGLLESCCLRHQGPIDFWILESKAIKCPQVDLLRGREWSTLGDMVNSLERM